ncbi:uncharacterized protein DUF4886 [Flavobacterium aquaticum]|uniref:Uncharacterized protein DUF4886 n=1 Tax=Flavobacterium aquaticum TaxID=1236486 RepID=A0A327YW00_9FLAO|nr:DUF4886 domain-containing protein [Flavobacterium aquaticum]RAK23885.1 uncharacterized protein DUF4886 [Flavobacterium aquaticum]
MKEILALLFIIFYSCKSKPVEQVQKVNILFIGNSLTYYHDMPKMVKQMLDEKSTHYLIEQATFPGMTLNSHLNNIIYKREGDHIYTMRKNDFEITETEKIISSRSWDLIIIQEAPDMLFSKELVDELVQSDIEEIKALNRNKNCKYIFFNTWIPKVQHYPIKSICLPKSDFDYVKFPINNLNSDEKFCSEEVLNEKEYLRILNEALNQINLKQKMIISNHPNIHFNIRNKYPEIQLYDDDYHPSKIGSFLNACIFYKMITNKNPTRLNFNAGLDEKTTSLLKRIANSN